MYLTVGGNERHVGEWAGYEIDRRACAGGGEALYGGRSYVSVDDTVESLVRARHCAGSCPVGAAVARLQAAATRQVRLAMQPGWWAKHAEFEAPPDVDGPALRLARNPCDTRAMRELTAAAECVLRSAPADPDHIGAPSAARVRAELAKADNARAALVAAHPDPVDAKDTAGLRALEEACRAYAGALERARALLAAFLEQLE